MSDLEEALIGQLRMLTMTGAVTIDSRRYTVPEREFRFHPSRRWRFDIAWPERKIAVEIEGGIYANGGHNRGAHIESDCEKTSEAAAMGWRVLRVTRKMIEDGRALSLIERALA